MSINYLGMNNCTKQNSTHEVNDLLLAMQKYSSCDVLAVGEPVIQRPGQLHQPQWIFSHP